MSDYKNHKREQEKNSILVVLLIILTGAVFVLAIGLAHERGHNAGYGEGWNDGRADGWQGCIEENNLYKKYGEEGE